MLDSPAGFFTALIGNPYGLLINPFFFAPNTANPIEHCGMPAGAITELMSDHYTQVSANDDAEDADNSVH